jgi:hypothetical protein
MPNADNNKLLSPVGNDNNMDSKLQSYTYSANGGMHARERCLFAVGRVTVQRQLANYLAASAGEPAYQPEIVGAGP